MATVIDVLQAMGWCLESVASLRRWYISSCRMLQPHLHTCPVRPEMPGALSWATMNMVSRTSHFVTKVYWMSLFVGFRLIKGSSGRVGGSRKRCLQRVRHFSL